jgi:hypothetical protein
VMIFAILSVCLLRLGGHPIASAAIALILVEVTLVLLSVAIKKGLVGSKWGTNHATPFWSWRHFAYFFAQDCFFVWCRGPLAFSPTLFSRIPSCVGWGVILAAAHS